MSLQDQISELSTNMERILIILDCFFTMVALYVMIDSIKMLLTQFVPFWDMLPVTHHGSQNTGGINRISTV